jgi:Zn-dependent protease with chaperone function
MLQLALLAFVVFVGLGAVTTTLAYPAFRARRPRPSEVTVRLWAAAPLLTGLIGTALCFLPALLSTLGMGADHCPAHDNHHAHFCWAHPPASPGSLRGWLFMGVVALLVAIPFIRVARELFRSRRLKASLLAAGTRLDDEVSVVETSRPLALTLGLFRPLAFVSRGLLDAVPADQSAAVVSHERAHVRGRDLLALVLVRLCCLLHLPRTGRRIVADLACAQELRCDRQAAVSVGDAAIVASAIVTLERLQLAAPSAQLGAAFGGSDVTLRVEALLEIQPDPVPRRGWLTALVVVAASALLIAGAPVLHHAAETLLELLVG